jgi:steroid 5-alpha reductase family enzyme
MTNLLIAYQIILPFIFVYMTAGFIFSIILKRNDIADIAWGLGFFFSALITFIIFDNTWFSWLILVLITLWSWRLAIHIFWRNKGKKEDYRYYKWRKDWGKWFYWRSFWQVFILQGILMAIVLLPAVDALTKKIESINFFIIIGLLIWILGFVFETISDYQLLKFVKNRENKGKLLTSGLWQYSRHPNYFGEIIQWWGIWLMSLNFLTSYLTIIGPLTITILILKISGIPLLEEKMSKHPDWPDYQKKVNKLIPFFPKKYDK